MSSRFFYREIVQSATVFVLKLALSLDDSFDYCLVIHELIVHLYDLTKKLNTHSMSDIFNWLIYFLIIRTMIIKLLISIEHNSSWTIQHSILKTCKNFIWNLIGISCWLISVAKDPKLSENNDEIKKSKNSWNLLQFYWWKRWKFGLYQRPASSQGSTIPCLAERSSQ